MHKCCKYRFVHLAKSLTDRYVHVATLNMCIACGLIYVYSFVGANFEYTRYIIVLVVHPLVVGEYIFE